MRPPASAPLDHVLAPTPSAGRLWTVRTVLFWLVLSCLLPGIIGAAALFMYEYRQGNKQLERDNLQTARALVQAVDNQILRIQSLAQGLATSDALAKGDLASFHRQAQKALDEAPLGSAVVLAARSGRQLLNSAAEFGTPLPTHGNPDIVERVFQTAEPVVSDIFIGKVLKNPVMAVAVPVLVDDKTIYVLSINVRLEHFNHILNIQGLPTGWFATIFDSSGTIAARSRDAQRFVGRKPADDYFQKLMAAHEGSFDAVMRDDIVVRATYASSALTQWKVAIAIPHGTLTAAFKRSISMMAFGIAILFAIGLGLAWLVGGKIAHAFESLIVPAKTLGAGGTVDVPAMKMEIREASAVAWAMGEASRLLDKRNAELNEMLQTLRESEHRLNLALKAGGTVAWELDVATDRLHPTTNTFFTKLGYAPGDLTTLSEWIARIHDEDRPGVSEMIRAVVESRRENYWHELRVHARDGSWHWILSQAIAAERDANGKAVRLIGTHTDITERKLAQEQLRQAAMHDLLTGLPNRSLVFEYGSHLLAAAHRNHGRGALLFIDLDRFKPINDLYGHEIGDRVLKEVGQRLAAGTRSEDLVGRLGGDEFVVILPHLEEGRHRAAAVAQHLVTSISLPYHIDSLELSISPSIGISYYPDHATEISELLHAADLAMYQVKQTGRANYRFYTPELELRAAEAHSLEARLKNALKHNRLALHYQPVVDIESGRAIGAEALLRLADDGAAVGPDRFIPVAESAGLIGALGEWVVSEACRQQGEWRSKGLLVSIAINVSPLQFRQRDFADKLNDIVADSGIEPACLQVEVTESSIMDNLDEAVKTLNRIKSLGMKVSLDDFGTGYSSLSRLTSLPLDKLKVDQSFVRRLENDQASRAVTGAIIALGRSLHLEVIGEGIESEDSLRYLQEQGCSQAQGFWFSRPLPASEFADWYREQQACRSLS